MAKSLPLIFGILFFSSCAPTISQTGKATYYSDKFNGRKTASGEIFRNSKRIAAHRTLPFGTKVKVINLDNGKSVRVRIADRGPFVSGRIIDLSRRSARKIGLIDQSVGTVRIEYHK